MRNLSKYIDHTLLSANTTISDIKRLCEEAKKYNFYSVCINSSYVKDAKELLKDSEVKICTVVGFPLGASIAEVKAFEAKRAIEDGADEIDMVINIGFLKSQELKKVKEEIQKVQEACKKKILKVIFETALLTEKELKKVSLLAKDLKVDFIKTSTGFSTRGASLEDIKIMKTCVQDEVKIKASGGIRDYKTALEMIEAGASRLGVSAGIAIVSKDNSVKEGY